VLNVYTLKTCDTCKKAVKWLDAEGIAHTNVDVRADGVSKDTIQLIVDAMGFEKAVNKRSTTWKALDPAARESLDAQSAVALIAENPTLMKRPAFVSGSSVTVGFDTTAQAFAKTSAG